MANMFQEIQEFRRRLDAGEKLIGMGLTLSDALVSEALGPSVDFIWFDLEHNAINYHDMRNQLIGARAAQTPVVVRTPGSDEPTLKRLLDAGVMGLVIPQIRSADEVRHVVNCCRYTPVGHRGWGASRSANYGRMPGLEHLETANKSIFVSVQIETAEAYAALDEILSIEGFDSVVIGPNDLTCSHGKPGHPQSPENMERIQNIASKARARGKHVGIGMGIEVDFALQAFELGCNWVQAGQDFSYLIKGAEEVLGEIREKMSS